MSIDWILVGALICMLLSTLAFALGLVFDPNKEHEKYLNGKENNHH